MPEQPISTITTTPATLPVTAAPAGGNPAAVYLASLAPGSRRTMAQALDAIAAVAGAPSAEAAPWHTLRYSHTQALRAALAAQYSAATANKMLSALRGVLRAAWRMGRMSADEYMAAADVRNVQGSKPAQAAGRALTHGELMALVGACNDGTAAGARDAAMLGLLYACGLRRAEAVGLDVGDVDADAGALMVQGKRNKVRSVPVTNGALEALRAWLAVRGDAPGPLFVSMRKGGALQHGRLTTQGLYVALQTRAEAAGVRAFTPHDLRRTYAGDLLDAGADIATVQKLMGHANANTTAGYDRRGERAKRDAARRLHYPYQAH